MLFGSKWNPQQTVYPLLGLAGAPDEHKLFNRALGLSKTPVFGADA